MTNEWHHALKGSRLLLSSMLVLCGAAYAGPPKGRDLVTALHSGGYVILMRHASSPRLPPQPDEANPDNTQHERQLDESGRASAREMGAALRQLNIKVGEVLSSPTYRALETVRLARFGTPKRFPELGDAGQSMASDKSGQRGAWLRAKVAIPPPRGANTVIVTHLPNVSEAFPDNAKGLEDGEALIFHPDTHGGASLVARVKISEWGVLASSP
jgi:phosphohistidine phosphatase SixA